MKKITFLSTLLLSATVASAMDSPFNENFKPQIKQLFQNNFLQLSDQSFEQLYQEHTGNVKSMWEALERKKTPETTEIDQLGKKFEKLRVDEKLTQVDKHLSDLEQNLTSTKKLIEEQGSAIQQLLSFIENQNKELKQIDWQLTQAVSPYNQLIENSKKLRHALYTIGLDKSEIKGDILNIKSQHQTTLEQLSSLNKDKEKHLKTVKEHQQQIETNKKTIQLLEKKNKQLEEDRETLFQQKLASYSLKKDEFYRQNIEWERERKQSTLKSNKEEIRRLEQENRSSLPKNIESYQEMANKYALMAQDAQSNLDNLVLSLKKLNKKTLGLEENEQTYSSQLESTQQKLSNLKQSTLKQANKLEQQRKQIHKEIEKAQQQIQVHTQEQKQLNQKREELSQQQKTLIHEKEANIFEALQQQFTSLSQYHFSQLYQEQQGSAEEIYLKMASYLTKKEQEEKEEQERHIKQQEELERKKKEHQQEQKTVANQVTSALLEGKSFETVSLLLNQLDSVSSWQLNDGRTFLHLAAEGGDINIVDLVNKKCFGHLNKATKEGFTPLYLAVLKGHKNAAKYLIKNQADVFAQTKQQQTILDAAIMYCGTCIENEKYDNLDAGLELLGIILKAMSSSDTGTSSSTPPVLTNKLYVIDNIIQILKQKKINEEARKRYEANLERFRQEAQETHQRMVYAYLEKKKEEKQRQKNYNQQYSYQPKYNYY
jgi:hypothetical protein